MKSILLKLALLLAVVSLACTVSFDLPAARTGELRTTTVNEQNPPEGAIARVELRMGGGSLDLSGGSSNLVSGTIEYNLEEWEPVVSAKGRSSRSARN